MSDDIWGSPTDPSEEPDPEISEALRSMVPPPHGYGFWADVDDRLTAEKVVAPTMVVPAVAPPPTPPPGPPAPPPPPPPPVAEVVPLPPPGRRGPKRWVMAVAAVLVVALGLAALVRPTTTDVDTTPAATALPTTAAAPTTTAPPTTAPAVTAPPTTKPEATSSTVARSTSTTLAAAFTLSLDGVGPLRLGMTIQQAEATGAVAPFDDPLDTGGACVTAKAAGSYRSGDFAVLYLEGRLARIYVSEGSRLRTPQGVGVGSPASKLSGVPGDRAESPHPYGGGTNVDITMGGTGYQFTVDQGVVREWTVGTTEALQLPEGCA